MSSRPFESNGLVCFIPSSHIGALGISPVHAFNVAVPDARRAHEILHVHLAILAYRELSVEMSREGCCVYGIVRISRNCYPIVCVEDVVASEFSRSVVKRAAACAAAHLGHHDVLEPEVIAGAFKIAFLRRHFERTVSLLGKRNSRIAVIIRTEDVITFCANCHHRLELDTRSRNGYIEHYFRLTETLQFEGITLLDEFERHRRC